MNKSVVWIFMSLALAGLAGCNMPRSQDSSPTESPNATQIFQTVLARLTQTQSSVPVTTASPPPVPGYSATVSVQSVAAVTPSLETTSQTSNSNQTCDRAAPGVPIDVTIPDDTVLQPGQPFTKIWRLRNVGTCTWTLAYRVELFSGDAMGAASSVPLAQVVFPGQAVDIAVDMVAPRAAGMFQGNWKLRNQKDQWFGIGPNGDSPFWVRIVIPATPTPSPTAAPLATAIPSATSTPVAQSSGTITLTVGTKIDLDNGDLDPASGADLSYDANSMQRHLLTPLDKAVLGVFGIERPNLEDCRSEAMGLVEYVVEDLSDGIYLCYHTDQGLPGWLMIAHLDSNKESIQLQYFTWAQP
jgi:Ig-like domain from next to BRCA1 gene